MLPERLVRDQPDVVRAALRERGLGEESLHILDRWLALDAARRSAQARHDALAQALHLPGNRDRDRATALKQELRRAQGELITQAAEARHALLLLPNIPDDRVPSGQGGGSAHELRRWQEPTLLPFAAKRHDQLATQLGILDLPRATRLSGARFPLLIGAGARLSRALASYMLDLHTSRGYLELAPPHLVKEAALEGTGHLPRHRDELYSVPQDGLWLSPTAEAQLVALHAGETLGADDLPLAYTSCTPAFRREAGSSGSAMPGLLRQHQFDKVELVRICTPEDADQAFDTLVRDAERVLQTLGLPYRVVALPAGDLPFASRRTYDLEVWMPGYGSYVEISSVSDCGHFQSRALRLRYRGASSGHRLRYPHTLNASALAIGRTIAALLENGQREGGAVMLPESLAPYIPELSLVPQSS